MSPDLAQARPCEECGAEAGQPCYPNCTAAAEHEPVTEPPEEHMPSHTHRVDPQTWVSTRHYDNRRRHTRDCWHFTDTRDPRPATAKEMHTIRPCQDCGPTVEDQARTKPVLTVTCPRCFTQVTVSGACAC